MMATTQWSLANAPAISKELAAAGVNMVRLPIDNRQDAPYVAAVRTIVETHAAAGIRTLLCPFGGVTWAPSAVNGHIVGNLWVVLGKPVSVLINTVNEPNRISNNAWLAGNRDEITVLRAKGYTQPIFVDCQDWAINLPVAEARQLVAGDPQLVFMSHRYGFSGGQNKPVTDAQTWVDQWSAAPDLCVGVGECGWYNGGGDRNALDPWLRAMAAAQVKAVQDGWLACALSWILKWDSGEQVSARALPLPWNAWGDIARDTWSKIRTANP